jgi:hypothetical protein
MRADLKAQGQDQIEFTADAQDADGFSRPGRSSPSANGKSGLGESPVSFSYSPSATNTWATRRRIS